MSLTGGGSLTLHEDLICGDMYISNFNLITNNNWIFSSGTIFMDGTVTTQAFISCNGGLATFGSGIGTGVPEGSLGKSGDGAAATTGAAVTTGQNPVGASIAAYGGTFAAGGSGGDSNPSTSGQSSGGLASFPGGIDGSLFRPNVLDFGIVFGSGGIFLKICGGAGGGAGAGTGGKNGGAGGGGGGVVAIVCKDFVMNGYARVSANGGGGGLAEGSNAGGGGGGSGGGVMIICDQFRILSNPHQAFSVVSASGGLAGPGAGTGHNGTAGNDGQVFIFSNRGHVVYPGDGSLSGATVSSLPATVKTIP